MRLSILSAAVSVDFKSFIFLFHESYFRTHKCRPSAISADKGCCNFG